MKCCGEAVTARVGLKFVPMPLEPDHSHGLSAPKHQVQQNTNLLLLTPSELDPNVLGLSILYLYAAYIYNGPDDWDTAAKCVSKENVGCTFFPGLFQGDKEFIRGE